jgi:hypothetical protein
MIHAIAAHAAASIEDLIAHARLTGRAVDCDPGLVPWYLADEECLLADALEDAGVRVTPNRATRARRLGAALRKARTLDP